MPELDCDSQAYKETLLFAVLPAIVVWIGMLPLFSVCMLLWNFSSIYFPNKEETVKRQASRVRDTKYFYGFFFTGLRNGLTNLINSEYARVKP